MAEAGGSAKFTTLGALALSVVSAVALVISNKALITNLGFNFATTLSGWHLVITYASLQVANWLNLFQQKAVSAQIVMAFGVINAIAIAFLNLSLGFNSVGFYQMTKVAIIPFTVVLETIFLGKRFSGSVQLSLLVLLVGVGVATVTDMELNFEGTVLSIFAIGTTCVAQIMTGLIQRSFKVSATQLLFQSSPYQVVTLLLMGPILDYRLTKRNVFSFQYSFPVVAFILLSCMIAVFVNLSAFLVIGRTSAVTYQVLGHLKTCLILTIGYVVLRSPFNWRNICGILIAMVGMALYTLAMALDEQQQQQQQHHKSTSPRQQRLPQARKEDVLIVVDNGPVKQNITEDATSLASSLWRTGSADKET